MAVDTDTVDTVDTTVERDPLMLNPNPKPMLLPMPTTDMVDTTAVDMAVMVDTTAEDTVMVDTDTVTIMARDLPKLNLLPITVMVDTDTAVDTDTVDTVDTVMADMVIMVDLF